MPISAVWDRNEQQVVVTFDVDLVDGEVDATNWTLVHSGGSTSPIAAVVAAMQVVLQFDGADDAISIEYDPPPFDVVGAPPNDLPAEAFVMPVS